MSEPIESPTPLRARIADAVKSAEGQCRHGYGPLGPVTVDACTPCITDAVLPLAQQLLDALADCVAKAADHGEQDGGFVAFYLLPTGPIHRAIPLLDELGVCVRPGFDPRAAA